MEVKSSNAYQQPKRYTLLLATNHLFGWTGSETLLLTLVEELLNHRHEIVVYARHINKAWTERHIPPHVKLTTSTHSIKALKFDLAHVQHNSCLIDIRATFPDLPILFSSLGVLPFLEQPIPFNVGVSCHLAISEEVASNLMAKGVPEHQIHIVRNLVSSRRFSPISSIRKKPERILVISYKMDDVKKNLLRDAAGRMNASIRFVGSAETSISQERLATVINEADVVVTLGRGVIESMLCGRVPFVFDVHGGDGLVTPDNVNVLQNCNFSGRTHRKEYTAEAIIEEIGLYRQEYGYKLREIAMVRFGIEQNITQLTGIYSSLLDEAEPILLPDPIPKVLSFCFETAQENILWEKRHNDIEQSLLSEIRRIKSTLSWRITKPLRLLANLPRIVHEWIEHRGKSK